MKPETFFQRVRRDALPPPLQAVWDTSMERHNDATFIEVFGNAPHLYEWYYEQFYQRLFYSGRIDTRVVELVRLRLANIHGCAFCNRNDRIAALKAGLSESDIDSLEDFENGAFSEAEKSALALAEVMALTNSRGAVSRHLYDRLKRSFTDAQLVELGVIMAVLCGMAKMIFAYDLVEKEDNCPFIPMRPA